MKQEAWNEQVKLQEEMQSKGINLIYCSDCSNVLLHKTVPIGTEEPPVICPNCEKEQYPNDCEDVYYNILHTRNSL